MTGVLITKMQKEIGDTQRKSCEDRGRGQSDVATSEGVPGTTRCRKRQRKIVPWNLQRRCGPADTLTLHFWLPEL